MHQPTLIAFQSVADLDQHEDRLIATFQTHPCFLRLPMLSRPQLLHLLLQRRFLSLCFTPVYDMAIDGLTNPMAKQIARRILREEYPEERGTEPSHREDLVSDLRKLGVTLADLFTATPTAATLHTIQATFALFGDYRADAFYQVKLLTLLRFWGEVLVAAEYAMFWPPLQALGLTASGAQRSVFYYPHYVHDAKQKPLTALSLTSATHSDQLGMCLKALLTSPALLTYCAEVEDAVVAVKTGFYDQFL